jgi:hypothetical protein
MYFLSFFLCTPNVTDALSRCEQKGISSLFSLRF